MDKYKISMDAKSVKQKMKDDLKKEGQTLKQIFAEEFGAFSNDTSINNGNSSVKKVTATDDFEWE